MTSGMVNTSRGMMVEADLEKRTGIGEDDDDKRVEWVEYWHEGELVHRSVEVILKRSPFTLSGTAQPLAED